MTVSITTSGDVALITIDNPPVNAANLAVRIGLLEALEKTEAANQIRAVVLRASGRTFTAGADVREFNAPPQKPLLPDVVLALEAATKPWVAALHGNVLGGGLELALGCSHRVAAPKTKLGLPEVSLGLIPGAGGTVRLPRLIDPHAALNMIVGGKPISAEHALKLGLIDDMAEGELTKAALALAERVAKAPLPPPLRSRAPLPISDPEAWDRAKFSLIAKARGSNAPKVAVEAVQDALDMSADEALKQERLRFSNLKDDPQSTALRHIFFAERAASKLSHLNDVPSGPISSIGVVGGGTMGAGIAANCLLSGLPVTLIERDKEACRAGADRVTAILSGSAKRGLITASEQKTLLTTFVTSTEFGSLSSADLIIEAVFEDMDVKHEVFAALDSVARPDAIMATNTSYLDVDAIAARTRNPARVLGLHFFSPAHVMKLLELVIPAAASPKTIATGLALGKRLGKIAVPVGVCDGFIGNRIMSAYRRECDYMVEDGALPWDIDAAMRDFGFPMGIYEMQDLAGLDIAWAMRQRRAATRDPSERYVTIADRLCEAGRLGRKTGAGWYDYRDNIPSPSAAVEALIQKERVRNAIEPISLEADQIMTRILTTMQAEAEACLVEGVARRTSDIDVIMVNGYGFPRWRGGPMFMRGKTD